MTVSDTVRRLIGQYRLEPHPEGGWFREFYRSASSVGTPAGYPGERSALTAIHFLLTEGDFSAFHRVRSDEVWMYMAGDPLEIVLLGGETASVTIGPPDTGFEPLTVVPADTLQGAHTLGKFTLVSCLVAPGFDFADFVLPDREQLLGEWPEQGDLVRRFTRA